MFFNGALNTLNSSNANNVRLIGTDHTSDTAPFSVNNQGQIVFFDGTNTLTTSNSITVPTPFKCAVAYDANGVSLSLNAGPLAKMSTYYSTKWTNELRYMRSSTSAGNNATQDVVSGTVIDFQYSPSRVTDAQLSALTIIAAAPPTESANNSFVGSDTMTSSTSVSQVIDSGLNTYALTNTSNVQILINGTVDPVTANVAELLYWNHTVYQRNLSNNWFLENVSRFGRATNRRPAHFLRGVVIPSAWVRDGVVPE